MANNSNYSNTVPLHPAGAVNQPPSHQATALHQYLSMDLRPNSQRYNDLMAHIEVAVQQAQYSPEIHLTQLTGEVPANLTSAMETWYQRVSLDRPRALAEVKAAFESDRLQKGAKGQFTQAELDKAYDEYLNRKIKFINDHRATKRAQYQKLAQLETDKSNARNAYEQMRADLGDREPKMLNWSLYLFGLLMVGVAEALLNYESFASIKWASPAIALGMTVLVAIALAFASHCHGTLLKQWEYFFGNHREDVSRWVAYRLLTMGSTAFTLALSAVYYARDTYLTDMTLVKSTIGSQLDTSPLWIIGGSLLGNVIVYVVGVMLAYFMHDSNPDYPDKKDELLRIEADHKKLQDQLDLQRRREFEKLSAKLEETKKTISNIEKLQRNSPNYSANHNLFAQLQQQDRNVEAALKDFRSRFLGAIGQIRDNRISGAIIFVRHTEEAELKYATSAEFDGLPIKLKYGHM